MTRMLCSLLAFLLITTTLGGCSLFESDEESATISDIDKESATEVGDGGLLDAEDEMLAESDDLASQSEDEFSESIDGGEEELSEDSLDQELESAELSEDVGGGFDEEPPAEGFEEFSATDDSQVDPDLAEDEFSDFEEEMGEDDFVLDASPADEFSEEAAPVVDVPQTEASFSGNQITNLEYKAFENGGTVVIETSEPAQYQKFVDPEKNQVIVQVDDVGLPEKFKRPYITKDFKQDIAAINAYASEGSARFVIQMKRPIEPAIQQEGNSILVLTSQGGAMTVAQSDTSPSEQPLDQLVSENQIKTQEAADGSITISNIPSATPQTAMTTQATTNATGGFLGDQNSRSGLRLNEGRFVGEKINLEFVDEDVRTIIELIADRSGVNLIMDKEVGGRTNLRLRQVPWDQALLVLLRSQGLGYVKQGSVLRIAKQETLSREAQAVSTQIKNEKEAKLLSSGIKVKYIPVSYADVGELSKKLKEFTSKEGKIAFDNRTSSLVITDFGEYIARIEELVRALDTPPMQVEIESKLVEAREDFVREAGINWFIAGQPFDVNSQSATINGNFGGPASSQGLSLDLSIGTFDIFGDLGASLSIFERQNKIKVLSQPRVVTMNKVKAEIEQLTQVPFVVTQFNNGNSQEQIQFQDLRLSLMVTPQITFKGDIIMDVELKREFQGILAENGQRELNRRRAKTTVMVKNGKTAVIGGIYQMDDGDLNTGIPLLKDIPLIGNLFRQSTVENIKNELLLFLKPKILKEIEGPLVSKVSPQGNFDPFEELSVDEGDVEFEDDEGPGELSFDDLEGEGAEDSASDEDELSL